MSAVCIIPARGGSVRIPGKNIRSFHGKPIIAYSIQAARMSRLFERVVVSTDDPEISAVAQDYEADTIMRPAHLGENGVGTQLVMRHAAGYFPEMEFACCLYATAPLLSQADLLRGWQVIHQPGYLYAMSVGAEPLRDIGCFYWGHRLAFADNVPLIDSHTALIRIPEERCCDINVEEDWIRAERMYAELHEEEADVR